MRAIAFCLWSACVLAAMPTRADGRLGTPVQDSALDRVRGGFTSPDSKLVVSFGVQRAVYIDGNLVASTGLQIVGGSSAASAGIDAGSLLLVQHGAGNTFNAGPLDAASAATVIQNTLNNQKIQTITAIDVTANSLQAYKADNLQSTLGTAITASLRR